ncbi:MAG: general secretion pathway protein GspK [Lentisphaerae bacterium]|nr:general secretion pathway protein GspK [Lentisphaerota bacterium]
MKPQRGSALIVVIWVVLLLSLLVGSFAFDAHLEARITSYYRKRSKAEYLARSGLVIARLLMAKSREVDPDAEPDPEDRWHEWAVRLKEGAIRGLEEPLGEGTVTVEIVPEPARRNINRLDGGENENERDVEANLERILEVGGISEEMWADFIDPFLDWIDADDESRGEAAETEDYYGTLEEPYEARNGPLDTVDELLLIRNFDPIVLRGGVIEPLFSGDEPITISGIQDLLTTYGDGKVNVNAAPVRVLMTLPGVDELVAGAIVEEREGLVSPDREGKRNPFESADDFVARLGLPGEIRKYVTTESAIYRVTSVGSVGGVRRTVWGIVEFTGADLKIVRWREED